MEINEIVKRPLEISKELEIINFNERSEWRNVVHFTHTSSKKKKNEERKKAVLLCMYVNKFCSSLLKQEFKSWVIDESKYKIHEKDDDRALHGYKKNDENRERTQFRSFQKTMRVMLVFGQCIGLNPASGLLQKDIAKIRFTVYSWRVLYTTLLLIAQTLVVSLCFYRLFSTPVSIGSLAFVSFYFTTWCTTLIFLWIATKWSEFVKEIFNCNLDEYVDKTIIKKGSLPCIVFLCFALLEHILSIISKTAQILDCTAYEYDPYEELIKHTFPWLFDLGAPFSVPIGVLLQYINLISTMNWNYSDMFIVCTSLYLTSVMNQVNKRILWAADKTYLPPSIWCTLREDFTRATRLVRLFDEVFSGLILISFASNLFFICLQLFNILANGINQVDIAGKCPHFPSGPLRGYEHPIYLAYSLTFLFVRFLTVSLVAASVNVASLVPATALYRVPSSAYCCEVQRFIDQVHGGVIALSGLDFFYITRSLVLSVAGTIVTYELVLLQFNNDELNNP
ncbi:gustatory receptor 5a for trehalose-like [Anticarsia gemmatalis]|uniref:gustatory receptor 5a for trehalose-like n=1 Tax=Anticarsia gemmatalis TaxID=129554 RepID=UPI003F770F8E